MGKLHKISGESPYESEKIKANTNIDGDVLCIKCHIGYLDNKQTNLTVSVGPYTEKKAVKIKTYSCNVCDYTYISDKHTKEIRKKFK